MMLCCKTLQILREVRQTHVTLAQIGVVEGQCRPHVLRFVSHGSDVLQVVPEQLLVVGMRTMLNHLQGTAVWTLASQVGNALFGGDDIDVVLR